VHKTDIFWPVRQGGDEVKMHTKRESAADVHRRAASAEASVSQTATTGTTIDNRSAAMTLQHLQKMASDSPRALQLERHGAISAANFPNLHRQPRLVAQGMLHRQSPVTQPNVIQCLSQGDYRTIESATLRKEDESKLAKVASGTDVHIGANAAVKRFKRYFSSKDHTWVLCKGQQGWMRDNALVAVVPAPQLVTPHSSVPPPRRDAASTSDVIAIKRPAAIASEATISIEELRASRHGGLHLTAGKAMPGSNPFGLGRPQSEDRVGSPQDYLTMQAGGRLLSSVGLQLSVDNLPFVLSTDGSLYGGPCKPDPSGSYRGAMPNHAVANVGSAAWAGMLTVVSGKVSAINNESGTYKFTNAANVSIVKFLYRQQVLDEAELRTLRVSYLTDPKVLDRGGTFRQQEVVTGLEPEEVEDDSLERKDRASGAGLRTSRSYDELAFDDF
jgi:hypothetical protein